MSSTQNTNEDVENLSRKKSLVAELNALNLKLNSNSPLGSSNVDSSTKVNDQNDLDLQLTEETAAILKLVFPTSPHLNEDCVMSFVRRVSSVTSSICSTNQDLSITQHQLVLKAVEVVCALGICPFLEKGVDSSLKLKYQYSSEVSQALQPLSTDRNGTSLLFELSRNLSYLIWSETCGHFILNKFLRTYLAALLQLVFSPTCRKLVQVDPQTYDRLWCCNELEKVLKNVFKPLLLSHLFTLQGVRELPTSNAKDSESLAFNATVVNGKRHEPTKHHIAPVWFRNACGRVITDLTVSDRQNGVLHLLETVLVDDGKDGNNDSRIDIRAKSLADAVCTIPRNVDKKDYLDNIVPQLVGILAKMASLVTPLEVDIVQEQYKKFCVHAVYILFKRHFDHFQQLVTPKLNISRFSSLNFEPGRTVLHGSEIRRLVLLWDLILFIDSPNFKETSRRELVEALVSQETLIALITCVVQVSSYAKTPACLEKMRSVTFELSGLLSKDKFLDVINEWVSNPCVNGWFVCFEVTTDGRDFRGVQRPATDFCPDSFSQTFVKFLSPKKTLASSLFMDLLQKSISQEPLSQFSTGPVLHGESMESCIFSKNIGMILKLKILDCFLTDHGNLLLEDVSTFLSVAQYLLQHFTRSIEVFSRSSCSFSILHFLFTILFALAEAKKSLSDIELKQFEEVENLSRELKTKLEELSVFSRECSEASTSIRESLESVNRFVIKSTTSVGKNWDIQVPKLQHREEMCDEERLYLEAYELMIDPMLPIKAAGMRKVSKLVLQGNKFAMRNLTEINNTILSCINDEDSYLFLSAVASLATIALNSSTNQISRLLELYCKKAKTSILLDDECVIKLGEAVTKFIIEKGELIVTERNRFFNALLFNCKADKSEFVRASSISNLSKIVKSLKFSIHLDVYEIVHMAITSLTGLSTYSSCAKSKSECLESSDQELAESEIESAFQVDDSINNGKVILKRSCIMLLTAFVELFQENTTHFEHLLDVKTIKEIYQVLSKCYHTDADYTCRLHAQMGLEEVNKAMKSFWVNSGEDARGDFCDVKVRGLPDLF